jgi:dimeric dUTPase (all-alpha-NTP-PPase superfamily)/ribosomal protein L37AE/L43A
MRILLKEVKKLFKRKCPKCFTRWYSSYESEEPWKCESCGADMPKQEDNENDDIEINTKGVQAMKSLNELCNAQRDLDYHIYETRNLGAPYNHDLYFDKTKLALLTEIGEFANATRCFKYWSDKVPETKERQLDEAADCLHFILRLFLFEEHEFNQKYSLLNIFKQYSGTGNEYLTNLFCDLYKAAVDQCWSIALNTLCCICGILGYTAEELENAYFKKHEENYNRQRTGY